MTKMDQLICAMVFCANPSLSDTDTALLANPVVRKVV